MIWKRKRKRKKQREPLRVIIEMIRNKLGEMRAYMETYCCSGKMRLKHNALKGEIMWG